MKQTLGRPILFSGEMVRAILAGRKTQTRRVVKPYGKDEGFIIVEETAGEGQMWPYRSHDGESWDDGNGCEVPLRSPYGGPGSRLWVRETHSFILTDSRTDSEIVIYRADGEVNGQVWRPSIFMPRGLSRIDLIIEGVRVERVQEISEADARAEGAEFHDGDEIGHSGWRHDWKAVYPSARASFASLWDRINAKRGYSWGSNPWVWVVEFQVAGTAPPRRINHIARATVRRAKIGPREG